MSAGIFEYFKIFWRRLVVLSKTPEKSLARLQSPETKGREKNEKGKRAQKKEPNFRVVCQTDVIKIIKMMIFRSNSPPPKKSLFCQKDGPKDDFVKVKQNSKEKAASPKPNEALSSFLLFFWLVPTTKKPTISSTTLNTTQSRKKTR